MSANVNWTKNLIINDIYLYTLLICLYVYPINVKTGEPIGPIFFVGLRVTPGKGCGWLNFQKYVSNKIRVLKILKSMIFYKIYERIFGFGFRIYTKRTCSQLKWQITRSALKAWIYIYFAFLFVCLSVRLYPINVKTAEPIGPKFCVVPHMQMSPGMVYRW